jgi:hypothetical protein
MPKSISLKDIYVYTYTFFLQNRQVNRQISDWGRLGEIQLIEIQETQMTPKRVMKIF